jgi:hypothetical protein
MRLNFRINHRDEDDDYVDMKCLECKYEEEMPFDILLECFNPKVEENPIFTCPQCDNESFVPKDIYDQITQNFIYK